MRDGGTARIGVVELAGETTGTVAYLTNFILAAVFCTGAAAVVV
jgi:hypothetical protein